jgi:hypothetical protein
MSYKVEMSYRDGPPGLKYSPAPRFAIEEEASRYASYKSENSRLLGESIDSPTPVFGPEQWNVIPSDDPVNVDTAVDPVRFFRLCMAPMHLRMGKDDEDSIWLDAHLALYPDDLKKFEPMRDAHWAVYDATVNVQHAMQDLEDPRRDWQGAKERLKNVRQEGDDWREEVGSRLRQCRTERGKTLARIERLLVLAQTERENAKTEAEVEATEKAYTAASKALDKALDALEEALDKANKLGLNISVADLKTYAWTEEERSRIGVTASQSTERRWAKKKFGKAVRETLACKDKYNCTTFFAPGPGPDGEEAAPKPSPDERERIQ